MSSKIKAAGAMGDSTTAQVPKLRFPAFRGSDAWEPTTIGALGRFYYGKSAPKWSLTEDAPTPCVRYGELYTKFGPTISETYSRTNTDPEKLRFSKGGEILIPRVGEKPEDFGKCCAYLPLKGIAIGEMISVLETKQHPLFYTYYFRNLHKQFAKVVEGQNVKNLYFTELQPIPIHLPTLAEQKKIAECLSFVDELIAGQSYTVNTLKTHKKGLMQQLFPRDGETQPRLRFHQFQNQGEWEEKTLEGLAKRSSGHTPSKSHPEYYNGGIKWVSLADSKRLDCGLISDTSIEISEKGIQNSSAVLHPEGTVLISRDAGVGKSAIMSTPMAVSQHFIVWTCKPSLLSNWFLYYLLQNSKPLFERAATGSTIKTIGLQFFKDLVFRVPVLLEQQRIANCLSDLDDLIDAHTRKLEVLKTHKKGLMQQLFPTSMEMDA